MAGQGDGTGHPVLSVGVDNDRAAKRPGLLKDIGQADAAGCFAAAVEFCGVSGPENLKKTARRDKAAGIVEMKDQTVFGAEFFHAQGNGSPFIDGFNGIGSQIVQHGKKEKDVQRRKAARYIAVKNNVLAE